MNSKFAASILLSTLALSSAGAAYAQAQILPDSTTFYCVTEGRSFATVAERASRRTGPIFLWRTNEFGAQYTPENRCNIVSERLNRAVTQNGGRLRNLLLTTGTVNRYPVICYVNNDRTDRCNSQNILITLDQQNRNNPDRVLQQLLQFGVTGSGDPIVSLVPNANSTPRLRRGYYSLENAVNQAFNVAEDDEPLPVRPSNPRPSNPRPWNPFEGGL